MVEGGSLVFQEEKKGKQKLARGLKNPSTLKERKKDGEGTRGQATVTLEL